MRFSTDAAPRARIAHAGLTAMPLVFVLLWSTGFIGAKFGLPYAEPLTFLFIRFVLTLLLLVPLAFVMKTPWPHAPALWAHIGVSGCLVHGAYLGGVFYGIYLGMPSGLAALLVGLQPLLTALLAGPFFRRASHALAVAGAYAWACRHRAGTGQ